MLLFSVVELRLTLMPADVVLRNGREDDVLFLTSFRTNHVTCCVSVGVETEEGVIVFSQLTQHSPVHIAGDPDAGGSPWLARARCSVMEPIKPN